jgi:hypothetical protein
MVVYHFLIQELFGGEQYQKFDPEQVATTLAAIWLAGMQSPTASANGANGNHAKTFSSRAADVRASLPQPGKMTKK